MNLTVTYVVTFDAVKEQVAAEQFRKNAHGWKMVLNNTSTLKFIKTEEQNMAITANSKTEVQDTIIPSADRTGGDSQ